MIDEIEQCFCPVGFLLDVPDGTNCVGKFTVTIIIIVFLENSFQNK